MCLIFVGSLNTFGRSEDDICMMIYNSLVGSELPKFGVSPNIVYFLLAPQNQFKMRNCLLIDQYEYFSQQK